MISKHNEQPESTSTYLRNEQRDFIQKFKKVFWWENSLKIRGANSLQYMQKNNFLRQKKFSGKNLFGLFTKMKRSLYIIECNAQSVEKTKKAWYNRRK